MPLLVHTYRLLAEENVRETIRKKSGMNGHSRVLTD